MSLSVLNNFELCYRGTSFKVQRGGSAIAAFVLAHNYVSEQFGNYVECGMFYDYCVDLYISSTCINVQGLLSAPL